MDTGELQKPHEKNNAAHQRHIETYSTNYSTAERWNCQLHSHEQEMDPIKRTATICVDQEGSKSTDLVDLGGVLPSSLVPGQQAN
jgi:hypothetical protein